MYGGRRRFMQHLKAASGNSNLIRKNSDLILILQRKFHFYLIYFLLVKVNNMIFSEKDRQKGSSEKNKILNYLYFALIIVFKLSEYKAI